MVVMLNSNQDALIAQTLASLSSESQTASQNSSQQTNQHDENVANQLIALAKALDRGTYCLVKLLPTFDRQQGWRNAGYKSCIAWLNSECGISYSAASDRKRVAYALETLPLISQLFQLGELSWSKVRAITRIAAPDNEQELVEKALTLSANELEQFTREYRNVTTSAGLELENQKAIEQDQARSVSYQFDYRGMVQIRASLPPAEGAAVLQSLARAEDELFDDCDGHCVEPDYSIESVAYRTAKQLRADALCLMASGFMASKSHSIKTADRYQLLIHLDESTLMQSATNPNPDKLNSANQAHRCHINNGPAIAASTAQRLACDCSITPILSHDGEPLSIGRRSRVWPAAISKAILARDEQCVFPGCTSRKHLQIHHIQHWAHGGETSVENGVSLCGYHHKLMHEFGYHIERTPKDSNGERQTKTIAITTKNGEIIQCTAKLPLFQVRRPDGSYI
jgi:hypothetical protein